MRLYERYGDEGFHTCLTTTFGINFDAYENIVLPRLRGANCSNNVLLVDGRMLSYALDGASLLPEYAGRHYTVAGVPANGVFHPKITLQLGRRKGRAIIASANMTASGLAGNLELAGQIECTGEKSGEARLVAAAWEYLRGALDNGDQTLTHQLQWLRARTPWLIDTEPATGPVTLVDDTVAALLTSDSAATVGIGIRFGALIEESPVKRLIVLSPYWDEDLKALSTLASNLDAQKVLVLIDTETASFPPMSVASLPNVEIFDLNSFARNRFVHAKAIIAETEQADHLLYGSANCTIAALGTGDFAGTNPEACLYRRLPRRTILEQLGLHEMINEGTTVRPDDLPAYREEEPVPLSEAGRRTPGQFECAFDTLFWRPPAVATAESQIELLDTAMRPMPIQLVPIGTNEHTHRRFHMDSATERPAFARLRYADGTLSAPAIVSVVDAMRETIREARGKKAESAALQLSEETEEGLWLWEVLNELETAELAQRKEELPGIRRAQRGADEREAEEQHPILGYEQFIAGRRLRSDNRGPVRNSLAGSEMSLVRSFLNRILMIRDESATTASLDDEAIAKSLDLGDETPDAAKALEAGEEFASTPNANRYAVADEEIERRRAARARASREQIVQAVAKFNGRLKEKAEARPVSSFDVLRLRAMLMIIAAAGQPKKPTASLPTLQILPLNNESDGWPKLMGQLLFSFFGGNRPAIQRLEIEAFHHQVPDDILECWATALWAMRACLCASSLHEEMRKGTMQMFTRLADQIHARIGLRPAELKSERAAKVFKRLNDRFSKRLGVDIGEIDQAYHI